MNSEDDWWIYVNGLHLKSPTSSTACTQVHRVGLFECEGVAFSSLDMHIPFIHSNHGKTSCNTQYTQLGQEDDMFWPICQWLQACCIESNPAQPNTTLLSNRVIFSQTGRFRCCLHAVEVHGQKLMLTEDENHYNTDLGIQKHLLCWR